MHFIGRAQAHPDFSVTVEWADGGRDTIDFRPLLDGPAFSALRADPEAFVRTLAVVHEGYALGWPDDLHFSADSLWYRTHPEDLARDHPDAAAE